MDITKLSDLELAKAQGANYQELMRIQNNLMAIGKEIERREVVKSNEKKDEAPA